MFKRSNSEDFAEMITRFSDKDIHDHPDLKCYMKCLMVETKTMDEDGNFDARPALEIIEKSEKWAQKILMAMGSKCARIKYPKDIDLCEKAFLLHKCLKEADPVVSTCSSIFPSSENGSLLQATSIFRQRNYF